MALHKQGDPRASTVRDDHSCATVEESTRLGSCSHVDERQSGELK